MQNNSKCNKLMVLILAVWLPTQALAMNYHYDEKAMVHCLEAYKNEDNRSSSLVQLIKWFENQYEERFWIHLEQLYKKKLVTKKQYDQLKAAKKLGGTDAEGKREMNKKRGGTDAEG